MIKLQQKLIQSTQYKVSGSKGRQKTFKLRFNFVLRFARRVRRVLTICKKKKVRKMKKFHKNFCFRKCDELFGNGVYVRVVYRDRPLVHTLYRFTGKSFSFALSFSIQRDHFFRMENNLLQSYSTVRWRMEQRTERKFVVPRKKN